MVGLAAAQARARGPGLALLALPPAEVQKAVVGPMAQLQLLREQQQRDEEGVESSLMKRKHVIRR